MSHFSTPEGSYELRQRLRRSMPEGAFEPEPFRGVVATLAARFGVSGHDEKASRTKG